MFIVETIEHLHYKYITLYGGARGDAHLARVPRYLLLHHPRRLGRHRAVVVQGEVVGLVTGVPGTASVRATE